MAEPEGPLEQEEGLDEEQMRVWGEGIARELQEREEEIARAVSDLGPPMDSGKAQTLQDLATRLHSTLRPHPEDGIEFSEELDPTMPARKLMAVAQAYVSASDPATNPAVVSVLSGLLGKLAGVFGEDAFDQKRDPETGAAVYGLLWFRCSVRDWFSKDRDGFQKVLGHLKEDLVGLGGALSKALAPGTKEAVLTPAARVAPAAGPSPPLPDQPIGPAQDVPHAPKPDKSSG